MPSTEPVGEAVPARAAAGQDGGEATWDVTGYGAVSIIASGVSAAHDRLGFGGVLARGSFGDEGRDVWL